MPEERGLYPSSRSPTSSSTSRSSGHGRAGRAEVQELLERFGLGERAEDKLEKLSLGNQQRVQIIAALLPRPGRAGARRAVLRPRPAAVDSMGDLLREHTRGARRCSSPPTSSTSSSASATGSW